MEYVLRPRIGSPEGPILDARAAYNLIARRYDSWHWQRFWRENEAPLVQDLVAMVRPIRSLLDVGTGTGFYMATLKGTARQVTGVDISENMLAVAREHLGATAQLIQADVTGLPLKSKEFDLVVGARVLSHVKDLSRAIAELARVVRRGGFLVLTDVDPAHDYRATRITVGRRSIYVNTYKWTLDQLSDTAKQYGLSLKRSRQLTAKNLRWLPESDLFHTIDRTGGRPIGYLTLFRRIKA